MEILIKIIHFILSFSLLIILHEWGHFYAARLTKTRVEKFYLFFNPWFSLFKKKVGDTEYGVGWIPAGGYVKISGMIDESMDMKQMKKPAKPDEFRSKSRPQKLMIMAGGVVVNFILGIVIFSLLNLFVGKQFTDAQSLKNGYSFHESLEQYGFQDGDLITKIDGEPVQYVERVIKRLILDGAKTATVLRNGAEVQLVLDDNISELMLGDAMKSRNLLEPNYDYSIKEVLPGSYAATFGLKAEDKILSLGGRDTPFFVNFRAALMDLKGQETTLVVLRGADTVNFEITVPGTGLLGFIPRIEKNFTEIYNKDGFFEAWANGFTASVDVIAVQLRGIILMIRSDNAKVLDNLAGPIGIGNLFPSTWDWLTFWRLTATLSIIVAFFNLLPIPALDGGHILFLCIEGIIGRDLSPKVMGVVQTVGFIVLMGLMVIILGNDIFRFILTPLIGE